MRSLISAAMTRPARSLPADFSRRPVDEYHLWRPEDGNETIVARHSFEALLLPCFTRATLEEALQCDTPRRLWQRGDGLLVLTDGLGRPTTSRGRLLAPDATLRFVGIAAIRLS